ncbi:MAG TPA: NAD(P)-dependent alcohol dehydrogenase [Thermoanaerobaculia bacterium]|nr:NAD(P)-dependent alcohol dehydrogenase [Thermoanaerobaculia bacterium]
MKAITCTEYGSPDVLKLTDVERPTPTDHDVLIRVRSASVNPLDWRLLRGKPVFIRLMLGGLRRPKAARPGVDAAGQVEAVGRSVTGIKPGDEVFGVCRGAFAEYACAAEDKLALKPASVSFETAASVPVAAISALQALRDQGGIRPGQQVLIEGASGGVGTFAVQMAKSFGADVTAVCSTGNVERARSLGADRVIDYSREDFTKSGSRYDLIIGANSHRPIFDYRRALGRNGTYVMVGGGWSQILQGLFLGPLLSWFGSRKMTFFMARITRTDLAFLGDLLAAGKLVPVIDRRYPLGDVAEAVRYLEDGHARGKVVITVDPQDA